MRSTLEKPSTASAYIDQIEDEKIRLLSKKIRAVVRESVPEAVETVKMGAPCYTIAGKMFASIADYSRHVNLYFFHGAKLSSKRLEGSGKGMRHIKIRETRDIDEKEFSRLLREAANNAKSEAKNST